MVLCITCSTFMNKTSIFFFSFSAICYICIVYKVKQQNKNSSANQNRKLKKSRKHQNRKIPTPPNSPLEGRKIVSTLEVDVALDPSPLAFAPWSLKYQANKELTCNEKSSKNHCTSLDIQINNHYQPETNMTQNVQIESISDCTKSLEEQTETSNDEKLPSIPTLSIVVEECYITPENEIETKNEVQAEVHRQENGNIDTEQQDHINDEHIQMNPQNVLVVNKDYLKIPSIFYG